MSKQKYYSIRSFFSYLKHYKARLGVVLFGFIVSNVSVALIPLFIGKLIGELSKTPLNRQQVFFNVWVLIILSVSHSLTWHISEYLYVKLLRPLSYNYETIAFKKVVQKPYPYFVDKFTGKISAYIDTIGQELYTFIDDIFYKYANQLIRLVSVVVIFLSINLYTGAIFVTGLLAMFLIGRITIRKSIRYERIHADVQSTKNGKIVDAIANFVNIKSFHSETKESLGIQKQEALTLAADQKSFLWGIFFWGSMSAIVWWILLPSMILINVYLFVNGRLSVSQIATILSTILLFSDFIWNIVWNVSRFNIKFARIEEAYLHLFGRTNITKGEFEDSFSYTNLKSFDESFQLKHLNFAYPDKKDVPVLSDLSILIHKGEKVGVVGKSGSGKTTITKLLLGYYPIRIGELMLDDKQISSAELSKLIAYVPQDTSLFHRSIADNIAYATTLDVSREDIIKAAKQAHADEFIYKISDGYEAMVGERGVKLSAGQRQRIAIARAFLDNKSILVLDEATSALDSESEVLVQEALEALWQNKTVIAIAHRLSTLRNMDRIIVMDKGRIVESGTHAELLAQKGKYAKLWAHQSGGFLDES